MKKTSCVLLAVLVTSAFAQSFDARVINKSSCTLKHEHSGHTTEVKNHTATKTILEKSTGNLHADVQSTSVWYDTYTVTCPGSSSSSMSIIFDRMTGDDTITMPMFGTKFDVEWASYTSDDIIVTNK